VLEFVGVGFIRPEAVSIGRWDIREENLSSLKQVGFIRPVGLVNQAPTN